MFERFTERARRVIILAQEEAKRLDHSAVGTEHILLGIIREGSGVASTVLESLNINPERVRQEIESAIGRGERTPYEEVAFTPRAKKVLELALDEARRLGHNYIGTEHLLLGLIREGEGVAARVLEAMGADLERARSQLLYLLGEIERERSQAFSHLSEEGTASYTKQPSPTPAPGTPSWEHRAVMGMAKPGEPSDQITARLDQIASGLTLVHGDVQKLRTELQVHFWKFAALVLAVGILAVGLVAAALFFRH